MQSLNLEACDAVALEHAVGRIASEGGRDNLPLLITLMQKNMERYDRKELLSTIVDTIGKLGLTEAAPALLRMLNKTAAFEVQKRIIVVLKQLPHEDNIPTLERMVLEREKMSFIRMGALEAIGVISSPKAVRALASLLFRLEELGAQSYAQKAKELLISRGEEAFNRLVDDLSSPEPIVKLYAAKALGDLGNKEAIAALRKVVEEKAGKVSKIAAESALLLYLS